MMSSSLLLILGFALDWALPLGLAFPVLPHPVRGIGHWLNLLEPWLRTLAPHLPCNEISAGWIGSLLTLSLTGVITALVIQCPLIGPLCAVYLCWSGLALGHLLRVAKTALSALEQSNLPEARRQIGELVSRNVSQAEPAELYRALAETLAENFNDAFVAPLFWLVLGGPVGLWLCKAAGVMDSMWGYHTPRWERLGKAAARLDDVQAYLPARLSALLLWGTAFFPVRHFSGIWPGFATVRRQAAVMSSPNAGWPMTVAAWLHHAPMGGPTLYHGVMVQKPHLGPEAVSSGTWDASRVRDLLFHLRLAGLLGACLALLWTLFREMIL